MGQKKKSQIYPFISVIIIIVALFTLVFLQMEVRRLGYKVLKQSRELKTLQDEHRMKIMRFAKVMRPQRLRNLAMYRFTLNEVKSGQIIHMAGERIALRQ